MTCKPANVFPIIIPTLAGERADDKITHKLKNCSQQKWLEGNSTSIWRKVNKVHCGIPNPVWLILCIHERVLFCRRQNAETARTDKGEVKGKIMALLCCNGHFVFLFFFLLAWWYHLFLWATGSQTWSCCTVPSAFNHFKIEFFLVCSRKRRKGSGSSLHFMYLFMACSARVGIGNPGHEGSLCVQAFEMTFLSAVIKHSSYYNSN